MSQGVYSQKQQTSPTGLWILFGRGILVLFAVATTSLIFRVLSIQEYGLYSWVLLISQTMALLAEVGGNTATLTFIPKFLRHQDYTSCRVFFLRNLALQLLLLLLFMGIYFLSSLCLEFVEAPLFGATLLLATIFVTRDATGALATALFKVRKLALTQACAAITGFIVMFYLTHIQESTARKISVQLVVVASSITTALFVGYLLFKIVPKSASAHSIQNGFQGGNQRIRIDLKRLFFVAYPPYINGLLGRFFSLYSEPLFLGLFVSLEAVGVYSLANTHVFFLIGFLSLALQQFLLAHMTTRELEQQTLSKLFELFQILFVPIVTFLFFFAERYFIAIFGAQAAFSGHIASFIGIVQLLAAYTIPPWILLSVAEKGHSMIPFQLVSALITIVWDIGLIPTYGIYGAIVAPACSFLTTLWYRLRIVRRHVGPLFFPWISLVRVLAFSCLAAAISYLVTLPVKHEIPALLLMFSIYLCTIYMFLGKAEKCILQHFGLILPKKYFFGGDVSRQKTTPEGVSLAPPRLVIHLLRRYTRNAWGGTEQAVRTLIRESKKRGVVGKIYTTSMYEGCGPILDEDISITRFPYQLPWWGLSCERKQQLEGRGGNLLSWSLLFHLLFTPNISLLHLHVLGRLGAIGRFVAKLRGIPYVVTIHGGYWTLCEKDRERLVAPGRHGIEWGRVFGALFGSHRLLQDANAIICISREEQQKMARAYPGQKVRYIPHGIDPQPYRNAAADLFREQYATSKAKIILSVGRIDRQKNQLRLIEAFMQLGADIKEYHLVLIGAVTDYEYMSEIENSLQALSQVAPGSYTLIKGLPPLDPLLLSAYKAAACVVLPSIHEPFGLVVLEAWSAGVPIIASNCGGLRDLLKSGINSLIIDPHDVTSIVEAIKLSTIKREQLIVGGFESVQSYTAAATAEATCALYEEVSLCEC